jgi:hypothetical protein
LNSIGAVFREINFGSFEKSLDSAWSSLGFGNTLIAVKKDNSNKVVVPRI